MKKILMCLRSEDALNYQVPILEIDPNYIFYRTLPETLEPYHEDYLFRAIRDSLNLNIDSRKYRIIPKNKTLFVMPA